MKLTARVPRNIALQERLIKGFAEVIHKETGVDPNDGWQIVNALTVVAATIAYRNGAQLGNDVTMFADSIKDQTSEALIFMIQRGK